jgi:hypothetical protein
MLLICKCVYCADIDYLNKKMLIKNQGHVQNQNLKFKSSHLNQGKCEQIKCKSLKFFWYIIVCIGIGSIIWIINILIINLGNDESEINKFGSWHVKLSKII